MHNEKNLKAENTERDTIELVIVMGG